MAAVTPPEEPSAGWTGGSAFEQGKRLAEVEKEAKVLSQSAEELARSVSVPNQSVRIEELKKKIDGMIETVSGRITQLEEFKRKQISLLASV